MDPNEALKNLREAIASATGQQDADTDHGSFCVVNNRTVTDIINSFEALDEWLSRGGFLPADWARNRGE